MTASRLDRLSAPVPLGLWLDFRAGPGRAPSEALYRELLELAAHADATGFAFALVSEHHASADGYMPTPHVALAAIAGRTRRMLLGAGVALAPLWPARVLAEELAVLDLLSGGRALAGLGIGYATQDYEAMNGTWSTRGRDLKHRIGQLRAGWAGEPLEDGYPVTPRPSDGTIPVMLGGFVPRALDRAARLADVHFAAVRAGHPWREAERYRPALAAYAQAHGRPAPRQIVGTHVWVLESEAQWTEELGPALAYQRDAYVAMFPGDDRRPAPVLPPREHYIVGDAETVARDLRRLLRTSTDAVCLWARPPGVSHESAMRNVTRLAREVVPALARD